MECMPILTLWVWLHAYISVLAGLKVTFLNKKNDPTEYYNNIVSLFIQSWCFLYLRIAGCAGTGSFWTQFGSGKHANIKSIQAPNYNQMWGKKSLSESLSKLAALIVQNRKPLVFAVSPEMSNVHFPIAVQNGSFFWHCNHLHH